ncbi:MAG: SBBP repeat-containing protein, partial [Bacteroidota bacterium]
MKTLVSGCLLVLLSATTLFAQGPTLNLSATDVLCNGDTNGQINLTVTGGMPPMNYTVNGGGAIALPPGSRDWMWVEGIGGAANDFGEGIALDDQGNSYVTGYYDGTLVLDSVVLTTAGVDDIFLAKYDPSGNVIWAVSAGGAGFDAGRGIAVDDSGNVYISGYIFGTAMFDSIAVTSAGDFDAFLAKYDSDGNIMWAVQQGGTSTDAGRFVNVDAAGNVFVVGEFRGTVNLAFSTLTSAGFDDIFLAKYDPLGQEVWARQAGGAGVDRVYGVDTRTGGALYICGLYSGTATFDTTSITSVGLDDSYVARYDTTGAMEWVRSSGGLGFDAARGVSSDGQGNAYATGFIEDSADFGAIQSITNGTFDVYVARYDAMGNEVWVTNSGGSSDDFAFEIYTNDQGQSYVSGQFSTTATFGSGSVTAVGGLDAFVATYDSSGNAMWVLAGGSAGEDFTHGTLPDPNTGSVYTAGTTTGNATFGPLSLNSNGGSDAFVARISPVASRDTAFNLGAGTYTVVVIDTNGNVDSGTVIISEPPALSLSTAVTNVSTPGAMDGAIDLSVTGGTAPYAFVWSNLDTTEDITNLMIGTYTVTVTDFNGCTATTSAAVDTTELLNLSVAIGDVTCIGTNNGSIDLTVNGGSPPYQFIWSNNATLEDLMNLPPGIYSVTVTDQAGTTATLADSVGSNPIFPPPQVSNILGPANVISTLTYLYTLTPTNGSSYTWSVTGGNLL